MDYDIGHRVKKSMTLYWSFYGVALAILAFLGFTTIQDYKAKSQRVLEEAIKKQSSVIQQRLNDQNNLIDQQIADQFKDEKVQKTLERVASTSAQEIMSKSINPEVQNLKAEREGLSENIASLKKEYHDELVDLSKEIDALKTRGRVLDLADSAVSEGSRSAYEELKKIAYYTSNKVFSNAALTQLQLIKQFYGTMERHPNVDLTAYKSLSFQQLKSAIDAENNPFVRAEAIPFLKNRRENGIPEYLLEVMKREENLAPLRSSIIVFSEMVGCDTQDVFDTDDMDKCWVEKKESYLKKVQERH